MMTLLTIAGIIILFILAKFIFDTFLTNRTKKDWNQYQKSNPEGAARILRNSGLDFSIKSSTKEQDNKEATKADTFYKKTKQQVLDEFLTKNPELARIVKSDDVSQIRNFLSNNTELTESIYLESEFADKPAEIFYTKADKLFEKKDYFEAILLINKGLEYDDPETESSLYNLRSDCNKQLENYNDALSDMDEAINSLLKYLPENYFSIGMFLEKRSEMKQQLGDELGASQDYNKAKKYYAKDEATNMEYDEDEKADDELY